MIARNSGSVGDAFEKFETTAKRPGPETNDDKSKFMVNMRHVQ
jgi:hypothetical protein